MSAGKTSALRPLKLLSQSRRLFFISRNIVRELVSYCFFVTIVYIISYGNRDPMSFKMQDQMRRVFVTEKGFDNITTSNDW